MAQVATPSSIPPNSHRIPTGPLKGRSMGKRKTPSELRGEQLTRANVVDLTDESQPSSAGSINATAVDSGIKKSGMFRAPRYAGTRLDEVFAAKKSRFRTVSGKENVKENPSLEQTSNLKNLSVFSTLEAKRQQGTSCSSASGEASKDGVLHACQTNEKSGERKFLNVAELSSAANGSSASAETIDMGKALKGLATLEPLVDNGLAADSSERCGDSATTIAGSFFSEFHVPGQKAPLDLTLKTSMRIVSSSSVNWNENMRGSQGFKILHSWMYPQSVLPPSLISVLSSSTSEGELEFLRKRQGAWEESFRDLYYMLRKNTCGLFYVCTSQFVVMFTGGTGDGSGKSKCSCNAYMSQSTRGLRSLLRQHDLCFSMPLCRSKVEEVTTEDLVELSEIEKQNLGQTRGSVSFSDVDNSPESLLFFSGNYNVHGLYELLLHYRTLLTSLSGVDVPLLCSPVPFQNAALTSPNIKCMEMRRAGDIAASDNGSIWKDSESAKGSSDGSFCSIEIKDTLLPPWIICAACALMGSEGRSFEASFVTEPSSIGLNVALKSTCEKSESKAASSEGIRDCSSTFGISEAIVTSSLCSCTLKCIKYCEGSYTASLSPV